MSEVESSIDVWERNKRCIPGGVVSVNRTIEPMRVFVKAQGAYLWDAEGRRYVDYHAAFSPYLLGHADPDVDAAVIQAIGEQQSLMGAGTTIWEGELARLLVECVPTLDMVQITNTGSEATYAALRIARAATGRDGVVIMQGGYNGWHNDVAFNLMDPLEKIKGAGPGEERPLYPFSGGIPRSVWENIHAVEFNDLKAVETLLRTERVAGVIIEPILQNIGVVKPQPGYLQGLRELCTRYGTLLIFDEVKTGFRHALGGYQSLCCVQPDLTTFGKAVANGYPLAVVGGKKQYMEYFVHPDPGKRVLIAGTYNAHPVPVAAALATLRKLKTCEAEIYPHLEHLGQHMEEGLNDLFARHNVTATVVRQGSAFVTYFMDHEPGSWIDIAAHHDMEKDLRYRRALIEKGVFHFPLATKQGSVSLAHTEEDIDETLRITDQVLREW